MVAKELKNFVLRNGELYYQGSGGVLARAISKEQAKAELEHVHELCCVDNEISLYRCFQRKGYYWPGMKQDAAHLQGKCTKCQEFLDVREAVFVEEAGDWR